MNHKLVEHHIIYNGKLIAIVRCRPNFSTDAVEVHGVSYTVERRHHKNRIVQCYVRKD